MTQTTLSLVIICHTPPADGPPAQFGLQDKTPALHPGTPLADGSLRFAVVLALRPGPGGDLIPGGPFVHGRPGDRFLYLSLGVPQAGGWHWLRRLKIPLAGLSGRVVPAGGWLEGHVDGTRSATVPLLDEGWRLCLPDGS
ncbi:MAG: DUF5990 family protein [Anaerolineae bacterium]|jgi:hypothetical protein|nr:DUF5990 family protein [Anaerolineae bacterium]